MQSSLKATCKSANVSPTRHKLDAIAASSCATRPLFDASNHHIDVVARFSSCNYAGVGPSEKQSKIAFVAEKSYV
jgi:hypothetical protein